MSTAIGHGNIPAIGLPQRLLLARAHANLNQTELAALMGVSRKTIANAESGHKTPLTMTLRAWAHATDVDSQWLQTGEAPAGDDPDGGDTVRHQGFEPRTRWYVETPSIRGADVVPLRPIDTRKLVAA